MPCHPRRTLIIVSLVFFNSVAVFSTKKASQPCGTLIDLVVGGHAHRAKWTIEHIARLRRSITEKEKLFTQLLRNSPAITEVTAQIAASGNMHRGVYRVTTGDGRSLVLKISLYQQKQYRIPTKRGTNEAHTSDIKAAIAIQNQLSEFGRAPRVYGLLTSEDLVALLPKIRRVANWVTAGDLRAPQVIGILMEEVPGAWNIRKEPTSAPYYLHQFTLQHWTREVQEMKKLLNDLQIQIIDEQLCTSAAGKVTALDLEYAIFLGRNKVRTSKPDPLSLIQIEPSTGDYVESITEAIAQD